MTKCGYCKETIHIGYNTFSGIPKIKFCLTCWGKIYTIHKAMVLTLSQPELFEWALKITLPDEMQL
jgi:hypothetical protein